MDTVIDILSGAATAIAAVAAVVGAAVTLMTVLGALVKALRDLVRELRKGLRLADESTVPTSEEAEAGASPGRESLDDDPGDDLISADSIL